MKILILLGTSRKDGNSTKILDLIKKHPYREQFKLDTVYLIDYNIRQCISCYGCSSSNLCIINDDVNRIVRKMISADAILYIPVIHAFSTNTLFQSFLERSGFGYLRPLNRPLKDKLANVVVIGRRYAHTDVVAQVFMNIYLNGMIIVGSGFPMTVFSYGETPGNVLEDTEGIDSINKGIARMVDYYHSYHEKKDNWSRHNTRTIRRRACQ